MIGNSDNNRSEGQGGRREALSSKEVCSEGTTAGTRTGSEAVMRAMSVLGNAKSNRHQKTHQVEPGGAGRKFMHLTRGGLRCESTGEVSRGRSSEEGRGNPVGTKGRRNKEVRSTERLRPRWREVLRNHLGMATSAVSPLGGQEVPGWKPWRKLRAGGKPPTGRRTGANRCTKQ